MRMWIRTLLVLTAASVILLTACDPDEDANKINDMVTGECMWAKITYNGTTYEKTAAFGETILTGGCEKTTIFSWIKSKSRH